jgi:hypothetical protein
VLERKDFDGKLLAETLSQSQVDTIEVHSCFTKNRGEFIKNLTVPSFLLVTQQISFLGQQLSSKITKFSCYVFNLKDLFGVIKNNSTLKELEVGNTPNVNISDVSKLLSELEFNTSLKKLAFLPTIQMPFESNFRMNSSLQTLKLSAVPEFLHKLLLESPNYVTNLEVLLPLFVDQNSLQSFIHKTTVVKSLTIYLASPCSPQLFHYFENSSITDFTIDAPIELDCALGIKYILTKDKLIGLHLMTHRLEVDAYPIIFEGLLENKSLKSFGLQIGLIPPNTEVFEQFLRTTSNLERLVFNDIDGHVNITLKILSSLKNNLSILETTTSHKHSLFKLFSDTNTGS